MHMGRLACVWCVCASIRVAALHVCMCLCVYVVVHVCMCLCVRARACVVGEVRRANEQAMAVAAKVRRPWPELSGEIYRTIGAGLANVGQVSVAAPAASASVLHRVAVL